MINDFLRWLTVLFCTFPLAADLISVRFFTGGRVTRINELTGAHAYIGYESPGTGLLASLTRDPITGTLYTVDGLQSGGATRLFTLDPNTGATTLVAPLSQTLRV